MKFFFLTHEDHLVPDISIDHNCLIVNVIHFVIERIVKDDFFVVAGEFCHAGANRRGYNLIIISVGEVKSAIIVVVSYIVVNHNHGSPSVENGVGDDGSERRAADDVVSIDIAAVNAVVEVVGYTIVVNRSDVSGNVDVAVVVVVVRVYVGSVRCGSGSVSMFSGTSGLSVMFAFVVTVVIGRSFVASAGGYRLR
jgi:uncharacterized membrane protein